MMNTPFDRHSIGDSRISSSRRLCRRSSSSALEILQSIDLKILRACNELMQARTESAKQRAQQTTELSKVQRDWEQIHHTWQQRLKPPNNNNNNNKKKKKKNADGTNTSTSSSQELYHEAVVEAFRSNSSSSSSSSSSTQRNEDAQEPNNNNDNDVEEQQQLQEEEEVEVPSMSPFLQARLASLCQLIHLMTLGEAQLPIIHNDSRAVVNWLHEEWERMEREADGMKQQIQQIQAQRERLDLVAEQYKRLDDDSDDDDDDEEDHRLLDTELERGDG
jgi:hypothetical protein